MALPLRWLDSTIAFPAMGNSGVLQSIYPLHVGSPYWAALSGPAGACCGQTCFCSDHQCGSAVFRVFPQKQICAFQGDFSYCQCSQPCRDDIGENRELVKELTGCLAGVRLPEEAVPRCPDCGRVLVPWVRDDTFLEGTFWQDSLHRYHRFLRHWIMDQSDKKSCCWNLAWVR